MSTHTLISNQMSNAPTYDIDPESFWKDPYPDLKAMRMSMPVAHVPQLGATLITRRDDVFENEKKIDVFSSVQPEGLMTVLMGENLMRKDGEDHRIERAAIFPAVSPKTVRAIWKEAFEHKTAEILDEIEPLGKADMVHDIAKRISGEALKVITGLTNMTWQEMDRVSQGMIDGIANYTGDPEVTANCHDCTRSIEKHIDEMIPVLRGRPDTSLLSVQLKAGLSKTQYYANVKLAISGGQNEVRDVIAGLVWAMITHPDQLRLIDTGSYNWSDAFDEYTRWMSPIGMSPRRIAKAYELHGVTLELEDRVFLMFGSANRDETVFDRPDIFDITQNSSPAVAFGAGPHFCAGAAASRCLIAEVAVPEIFGRLSGLRLTAEAPFGGWAFRGPLEMPVAWNAL